jgi:hypothetical protein
MQQSEQEEFLVNSQEFDILDHEIKLKQFVDFICCQSLQKTENGQLGILQFEKIFLENEIQ